MFFRRRWIPTVVALFLLVTLLNAQEEAGEEDSTTDQSADDQFFSDPFAVTEASEDQDTDSSFFDDPFGSIGDTDDEASEIDGDNSESSFIDLDSLFNEEMVDVVEDPSEFANPEADLLTSDLLEWGGRIRGNLSAEWGWDTLWTESFDPLDPPTRDLSPSVSADLFFDARPDTDFRAFGKIKFTSDSAGDDGFAGAINDAALTGDLPEGWTREEDENGDTIIRDDNGDEVFTVAAVDEDSEADPQTGNAPAVDLTVYELFSDFSYRDRIFFRFGKHTIQWGVGYFFSPADVLNLTAVDAEDPTAEREGPVSLKAQLPFGIHNAYLYVITNVGTKPLELALAPKIEFVTGVTELTLAAYYQQALAPRAIGMFSTSIGEVEVFGEAVMSLGSDRVLVRESLKPIEDIADAPEDLEIVLDTYLVDWLPIFSGTAGFRWFRDLESSGGSIGLIGQYWFNGEGYADSTLLTPATVLFQNPGTNGLAISEPESQSDDYEPPPDLAVTDITNWGRHYVALTGNWSEIFGSDLSFSILAITNLSDLSGIVTPSLSFPLLETFTMSLNGRLSFGESGDELTNPAALIGGSDEEFGSTLSLTVSVGLGGGSF